MQQDPPARKHPAAVVDLVLAVLGGAALLGLAATALVAVFFRYQLRRPIFGAEDLLVMALAVVVAISVVVAGRHGTHVAIRVNFGDGLFGRTVELVGKLIAVGICAFVAFTMLTQACGPEKACVTSNLTLSHRPLYVLLSASFAALSLNTFWSALRPLVRPADPDTTKAKAPE
jgi:TRAP-type C4-dicarboxylate transport system permease small subunit